MKARVCVAKGCRCKSTSSYWIPRLDQFAYLCVRCAPLVQKGEKELKS